MKSESEIEMSRKLMKGTQCEQIRPPPAEDVDL